MPTVLIVDDDRAMREALDEASLDLGFATRLAPSGMAALALLDDEPVDAVLLDLRMPGLDGLEVLHRLRARPSPPPVTILTAHATAANTIEAMRLGAFDHLTKPISRDELRRVLTGMAAVAAQTVAASAPATPSGLIGGSPAIREIQKAIGRLADSDATVLVTGETGVGKELAARALRDHGRRGAKPFVAVNCAAVPAELIESELFGHVRGAFTGATMDRLGAFREAAGGTLFLDEIGDMSLPVQAKILRALQERVVTPVGGKPVAIDVRVIAATHRDLRQRVRDGAFREDLFYRLHVVPLHLPPLRERLADIVPLAEHFLNGSGKRLSPEAAARLITYAWPGNVRELRNAVERAALLAPGPLVDAPALAFLGNEAIPASQALAWPEEDLPSAIERLEKLLIGRALVRHKGNRTEAARALGIHRQLLYAKMKRFGLDVSAEPTDGVGNADAAAPFD